MTGWAVTVLGGSSPYTVELVDVLAAASDVRAGQLVLFGRDVAALQAVAGYARGRLPCPVEYTIDLDRAITGADVVIQQIRFGDLDGRQSDADIAAAWHLPADETIGPAGLGAALRTYAGVRRLADRLAQRCPRAHVINLSNPLGPAVAALRAGGVERAWGVCELPGLTADAARARAGRPAGEPWHYDGFNHRGFVYGAAWIDDLLARLADGDRIGGADATTLRRLRAIPVKHFALVTGGAPPDPPNRARVLAQLRATALRQLCQRPSSRPAVLASRSMPWYAHGVLPLLRAIALGGVVVPVHLLNGDLPRETPVAFDDHGEATPVRQPSPPEPVQAWLDRFERHEAAVLRAAARPSADTILQALEADPITPARAVPDLTRQLLAAHHR